MLFSGSGKIREDFMTNLRLVGYSYGRGDGSPTRALSRLVTVSSYIELSLVSHLIAIEYFSYLGSSTVHRYRKFHVSRIQLQVMEWQPCSNVTVQTVTTLVQLLQRQLQAAPIPRLLPNTPLSLNNLPGRSSVSYDDGGKYDGELEGGAPWVRGIYLVRR